jgi:hypothetical protein
MILSLLWTIKLLKYHRQIIILMISMVLQAFIGRRTFVGQLSDRRIDFVRPRRNISQKSEKNFSDQEENN